MRFLEQLHPVVKTCAQCDTEKLISEFARRSKGNTYDICRRCQSVNSYEATKKREQNDKVNAASKI